MDNKLKILVVQRMQDYIKEHVFDTITPRDLSRITGYSPWYCARVFQELLTYSPAQYIRKLKLSKSALCLRDEKILIADVAFKVGFESVDGYQRAFRREFGCNPQEYAHSPIPIWLFNPYDVKDKITNKEINLAEVKTVFVQAIEKEERKVIIKRGIKADEYFAYCDEVGCEVWGLLKSIKSSYSEPLCMWLPQNYIKEGTSEYVQGIEVDKDYSGIIPEGFDIITLPKATYLMFRSETFLEENYMEAIAEIKDAIKKYDPSITGYTWDKSNPRIQLEPIGSRGYIELLAVKKQ